MAREVVMPALEMSQETATLLSWRKAPGDWVEAGEALMEIQTDKMTVEVEAPVAGYLGDVRAAAGDEVPVGQVIALLLAEGEGTPEPAAPEPEPEPYAARPLTAMRRRIGERLSESWTRAPQFAVTRTADMTAALARPATGERIPVTAVVAAAVAATLRQHPDFNAHFVDDELRVHRDVNLGIAVATPDGLVVPVVAKADEYSVPALARALEDLVARARDGGLVASEASGATFTVSNLGMLGVEHFTAIVNPPEVAILAVGAVRETVVAVGGEAAVRPQMSMTLVSDHRVVDGAAAAGFLRDLASRLEEGAGDE